MRAELVLDALGMAILRRRPAGGDTIMHSDHGTHYTSWAFGQRLRDAGLLPSMGTIGDSPLTGQLRGASIGRTNRPRLAG
ncbi:MAG: hypothetical protein ACRDRX_08490 [Pseudonocardiaceae bacterium]